MLCTGLLVWPHGLHHTPQDMFTYVRVCAVRTSPFPGLGTVDTGTSCAGLQDIMLLHQRPVRVPLCCKEVSLLQPLCSARARKPCAEDVRLNLCGVLIGTGQCDKHNITFCWAVLNPSPRATPGRWQALWEGPPSYAPHVGPSTCSKVQCAAAAAAAAIVWHSLHKVTCSSSTLD